MYRINQDATWPFQLTYAYRSTQGSQGIALRGSIELLVDLDADPDGAGPFPTVGIVGTGNSQELNAPAMYATLMQKPMISPGSTSVEHINKEQFSYLMRSIANDGAELKFLALTCKRMGFKRVSVLVSDDSLGRYRGDVFKSLLGLLDISVAVVTAYGPYSRDETETADQDAERIDRTKSSIRLSLMTLKLSGSRVIVNLSLTSDASFINSLAIEVDMVDRNVWLLSGNAFSSADASLPNSMYSTPAPSSGVNAVKDAFDGDWTSLTTNYDPAIHGAYNTATGSPLFDTNNDFFFDTSYDTGSVGDSTPDGKNDEQDDRSKNDEVVDES